MIKLVLLRHGESVWNKENRFTGWTDVDLSEKGVEEAKAGAQLLKDAGFTFDVAHTSVLKRAIKTLWLTLDGLDLDWIPTKKSWRLNERHYGGLQWLDKAETAAKHGDDQVKIWRRSYDIPPPNLEANDPRNAKFDPRYKDVPQNELPMAEALKNTVDRVVPYWKSDIVPDLKAGKKVLIAAHGNSIRALLKYLEDIPNEEIVELNIPTAVPLVYELTDDLKPIKRYYLGNQAEIEAKMKAVANQGKAK
ncbi:MAG TPA: 2,3-diphosphoglycerate-dependent phosphoglycerate mutase [Bdellovibrionales bacterium]|nr:2,3-diphosphoglycerate-dependent phosphoglycerate mutase [Bdellovibrionales bacterium]